MVARSPDGLYWSPLDFAMHVLAVSCLRVGGRWRLLAQLHAVVRAVEVLELDGRPLLPPPPHRVHQAHRYQPHPHQTPHHDADDATHLGIVKQEQACKGT